MQYEMQAYKSHVRIYVQVLEHDLDLRTVKYSIWKSGGDMRMFYRKLEPPQHQPLHQSPATGDEDNDDTTQERTSQNDSDNKK